MPATSSSAPGKVILFGEHAGVYGRPAIAAPVFQVAARAIVKADPLGSPGTIRIQAPNIGLETTLNDLPEDQPLAAAIYQVLRFLDIQRPPACLVRITSTIPVASGLGSGAAVSVALIRALAAFLGRPLMDPQVSALAYEVEKYHHGNPSGIDNTVITYRMPVFFIRGQPMQTFHIAHPFTLVIADTGITSPTAASVGDLRRAWEGKPAYYEQIFDQVGEIARTARQSIETGRLDSLGPLMNENHALLCALGVSSPELDRLVAAAREAGAQGAKLSGGGRGGNMIALTNPQEAPSIARALAVAGAKGTLITEIKEKA